MPAHREVDKIFCFLVQGDLPSFDAQTVPSSAHRLSTEAAPPVARRNAEGLEIKRVTGSKLGTLCLSASPQVDAIERLE
jgi:hypothetical protein